MTALESLWQDYLKEVAALRLKFRPFSLPLSAARYREYLRRKRLLQADYEKRIITGL